MTELNSTNNKKSSLEASFMGLMDYTKSVELQKDLMLLSQQSKNNYVIGLEHPGVVTLGYRANIQDEIYDDTFLPVERISRGGLATIHSEGQLVIYPVINLRELNIGAREYVLILLETTQELLKLLGIESHIDDKAIGLYTKSGKIAFCGIQIKNGISQHGLSLNVRNDLSLFNQIRSCGVQNSTFDSLGQHQVSHTLSELYQLWIDIFKNRIN
ncbi:lipoyl(octanoyl) transferase LipB [bacterium]|nr:lipoyl(octanoyl) transferase LipB [bacterium]